MRLIDADAVPQEFWEYEFDGKWRGCTIKDLLDSQPTVHPEPHWIPVTERLPEKYKHVLVTSRGGVSMAWYNGMYFEKGATTKHRAIQTAKAWMPLPEPYKGVIT